MTYFLVSDQDVLLLTKLKEFDERSTFNSNNNSNNNNNNTNYIKQPYLTLHK
jgi:hypothetical protein